VTPFTITLTPGPNIGKAAAKAAAYVVDQWLPDNAGGVHVMVTTRLAATFLKLYQEAKGPVKVRVSLENHIPLLEVL
jgi:hypothetical protein